MIRLFLPFLLRPYHACFTFHKNVSVVFNLPRSRLRAWGICVVPPSFFVACGYSLTQIAVYCAFSLSRRLLAKHREGIYARARETNLKILVPFTSLSVLFWSLIYFGDGSGIIRIETYLRLMTVLSISTSLPPLLLPFVLDLEVWEFCP